MVLKSLCFVSLFSDILKLCFQIACKRQTSLRDTWRDALKKKVCVEWFHHSKKLTSHAVMTLAFSRLFMRLENKFTSCVRGSDNIWTFTSPCDFVWWFVNESWIWFREIDRLRLFPNHFKGYTYTVRGFIITDSRHTQSWESLELVNSLF